ncbi:hypothetical protein M9H77_34439 [Catharanthus roseus]|uniref:Uncharacterized protein n=1 Tax=Catharanthus roseus TaxID=4058 RepID=A0ACB9ZMW5_CATRO|nr:hypothetical protein M9H77_34439 [Catharanthus roseus]
MHFCKGKVRLLMVAVVFNFDDEFGAVFRPGRCCLACMDRGLGLLRKIEDLVLFGAFPRAFATPHQAFIFFGLTQLVHVGAIPNILAHGFDAKNKSALFLFFYVVFAGEFPQKALSRSHGMLVSTRSWIGRLEGFID